MSGNQPALVCDSSFFHLVDKKGYCNALWRDNLKWYFTLINLNYYKSTLAATAHTADSDFNTKGVSNPTMFSTVNCATSSS